MTYFDKYGLLHDKPVQNGDPETSENSPLYTALYLSLIGNVTETYSAVNSLFDTEYREYKPTPVTVPPIHMSHDNMTGVACMAYMLTRYGVISFWLDNVPIFSLKRSHPRDIVFYGYLKHPILFWPLMWIPSICMIISCATTYKRRGEQTMLATDGKLLTLLRCRTVSMPITWAICNWLIKRNRHFGSWAKVASIYFRGQQDHPIVATLDRLTDEGKL